MRKPFQIRKILLKGLKNWHEKRIVLFKSIRNSKRRNKGIFTSKSN